MDIYFKNFVFSDFFVIWLEGFRYDLLIFFKSGGGRYKFYRNRFSGLWEIKGRVFFFVLVLILFF